MRVLPALLVLLLSSPCQASLNCLPYEAALKVYLYNGYLPDVKLQNSYGRLETWVNVNSLHNIVILVDENNTACELFKGWEYDVPKETGV